MPETLTSKTLVQRLRDGTNGEALEATGEAADEIERLERENERLSDYIKGLPDETPQPASRELALLLSRAAGWLAVQRGESAKSTGELIERLVAAVKGHAPETPQPASKYHNYPPCIGKSGPMTSGDCARWLEAKYSRHHELEDQASAQMIRNQAEEIHRLRAIIGGNEAHGNETDEPHVKLAHERLAKAAADGSFTTGMISSWDYAAANCAAAAMERANLAEAKLRPSQKANSTPPVDNEHVADGCEKFDV